MAYDLERDAAAFESLLPGLLAEHADEFALIQNGSLKGTYSTYEGALAAGYERFELTPFFVERVSADYPLKVSFSGLHACQA